MDNLDRSFERRFFPKPGPGHHILILSRDADELTISTDSHRLPLLDTKDAVDLLAKLSNIECFKNSTEEQQAYDLSKALGLLPLAIKLTGAYVREVSGSFQSYLEEYTLTRIEVQRRISDDSQQYPESVATAWYMSFKFLMCHNYQAAQLLRLLSFLVSDGVVIDFLIAGVRTLDSDIRTLLEDAHEMAKALVLLENYGFIKWVRGRRLISVHRGIQAVVRDELPDSLYFHTLDTVVSLCSNAFPDPPFRGNELCRRFENQVLEPLLHIDHEATPEYLEVLKRVAKFLDEQGNNDDFQRFSVRATATESTLEYDKVQTAKRWEHNLLALGRAVGGFIVAIVTKKPTLGAVINNGNQFQEKPPRRRVNSSWK
jgi:hypothetical protein